MKWVNFLHFYQPANSEANVIIEAVEKSYKRVIKALEENPRIKFTLNIQGCLYLRLEELGYADLINRIVSLQKNGQIELTGTVAYHPLLPLIPSEEIQRQIDENLEIKRKYFGNNHKDKGFFMPEMAYSIEAAKLIKENGFKWIILDEISMNGKLGEVNFGRRYFDKNSGLGVIFRSRKDSNSYVPTTLLSKLKRKNKRLYITATDGELYGLRHNDPNKRFEAVFKEENLETLTISEFIDSTKNKLEVELVPSSWNSTPDELVEKNYYSLWANPKNEIQNELLSFTKFVYKIVNENSQDENYKYVRWHLVRGLASCMLWWASVKDLRGIYGPISWSPDEIERGLNELIRAVRSLENKNLVDEKIKAENKSANLKKLIWTTHWSSIWKK